MYATGAVLLPFFAFLTYLIAVPTGIKFFNWIGTMWRGQMTFETPMLWSIGFLVTFLLGGLTGVLLASPPLDWHVSDSYFVVAHFHYVVFGTVVFAAYAGIYFWFPKMCGRMMDERLGKLQFWMTFIGFHGTFLVQHWLGDEGMPRRYVDYLPTDTFTTLNMISTIFAFVLGASVIPFIYNVVQSWKYGQARAARRPVGPRQLPGVGDLVARRRGTTSSRSPGSAPSAPRSRRTTRTWSSGSRTRPTRASGTSPTAGSASSCRAPARARVRTTPTPRESHLRRESLNRRGPGPPRSWASPVPSSGVRHDDGVPLDPTPQDARTADARGRPPAPC